MDNVIPFKRKEKPQAPLSFWDSYKVLLRKYHNQDIFERVVAAILDKEVYDNEYINTSANEIIDFSEENPFGNI